jgi:hypothetical protein
MSGLKHIFTVAFAVLATVCGQAQIRVDTTVYSNVFKFDLINAAMNSEYVISYERVAGDNFSLVLTGGVIARNSQLSETFANGSTRDQYYLSSGWLIQPEARFYLSEFTGPRQPGAYIGVYPFFRTELDQFQGDSERYPYSPGATYDLGELLWADYESKFDQFGIGFAVGLQVFTAHQLGFELQYFVNIQYSDLDLEGTEFYANGFKSIDRRQFNRDFTSGLRLQVLFGTRPRS